MAIFNQKITSSGAIESFIDTTRHSFIQLVNANRDQAQLPQGEKVFFLYPNYEVDVIKVTLQTILGLMGRPECVSRHDKDMMYEAFYGACALEPLVNSRKIYEEIELVLQDNQVSADRALEAIRRFNSQSMQARDLPETSICSMSNNLYTALYSINFEGFLQCKH